MPTFKHPCPHCGQFINRDVAVCPACGTPDPFTPGRCPKCGRVIEDPKWVACPGCGTPLGAAAAPATGGRQVLHGLRDARLTPRPEEGSPVAGRRLRAARGTERDAARRMGLPGAA